MDNIVRDIVISALGGTVVAVLNKVSFDFHLKGSFNKKEKKNRDQRNKD